MPRLWIKDETRSPTASNKDRATALVIEDGLARGVGTITIAPPATRPWAPPSAPRRPGCGPSSSCPPIASRRSWPS
ncbi:MAG TPA: hypothetical protein VFA73_03270 [Actinomycetota bacterium]|nr:hypothetical protein [Actinomycetota bacterium]